MIDQDVRDQIIIALALYVNRRGQGHLCPIKPDPTGALQIAKQLDITPSEFLYLGVRAST